MKRFWFKRKTYGWGWYPSTWQGWSITFFYIFLVSIFSFSIPENSSLSHLFFYFFLPLFLFTLLFIYIAYKTGEKPRWQWGEKNRKP
ncbi:hypothetical protein BH09PAT2_BH09PAT2_00220 [soil metagenome]